MQKILTSLVAIILVLFTITALFVFEIWPFNPSGPIMPSKTSNGTQQNGSQEFSSTLSDNSIARKRTYAEYMARGVLLEEKGYISLATAEFQSAANLSPEKIEPLIQIGRMNMKEDDFLKAKSSFEEALKIDPTNLNAKIYLGRSLLSLRKPEEAKEIFDSIEKPDQVALYYKGIITLYFGDYDKGKNLLNDSIKTSGASEDYIQKAKIYLSAFDEFNTYQGGQPSHLKTLLARTYNQTGEYQLAIPLLYEVIKQKKDYRDAWILLGYAYLNISKYQDAIDALEEAKKLDPQKPETLFFLGLAYFGVNDYERAAQNLETSKKNGFEPQVQIDQKLAEIYLQMKNYEKSATNYENVVALNSEDVDYFIRPIWICLERLNQPARASRLAQKAVISHPEEAMSYNLLAWSKIGENKLDEAETLLKKALELDPNLAAAYLNYGQLYQKKNILDQAIAYYKKAYEMGNGTSISASAAEKYNLLVAKMNTPQNNSILKASLLNQ